MEFIFCLIVKELTPYVLEHKHRLECAYRMLIIISFCENLMILLNAYKVTKENKYLKN